MKSSSGAACSGVEPFSDGPAEFDLVPLRRSFSSYGMVISINIALPRSRARDAHGRVNVKAETTGEQRFSHRKRFSFEVLPNPRSSASICGSRLFLNSNCEIGLETSNFKLQTLILEF